MGSTCNCYQKETEKTTEVELKYLPKMRAMSSNNANFDADFEFGNYWWYWDNRVEP